MYKLVVFIPKSHFEQVKAAVCNAGAGRSGNYDHCTFSTEGIGTFRPLKGAKPFTGKLNKINKVKEVRLEVLVEAKALKKVIRALKSSHPYEEPAFDIYKLAG